MMPTENVHNYSCKENNHIRSEYPLNALYFYLTSSCNLRCKHCWINSNLAGLNNNNDILNFQLLQSIIEEAFPLGLSWIKLTGGEPLLHVDIVKILQYLSELKIGINLETNGTLVTPEISNLISKCEKPFVSVSLDGMEAITHEWLRGVRGCFQSTLTGIRNLVNAGINPQIILTVTKRNYENIEDFIDFSEKIGANSVKINILQPSGRGKNFQHSKDILTISEYIQLGNLIEEQIALETNIPVFYSHPPAFRPLSRIYACNSVNCDACGILGIIGVLSTGKYALCGAGITEPDLILGDSLKDKLANVWQFNPLLLKIRSGLPDFLQGICSECGLKNYCLGSCIAQNYIKSQSIWAPYWYCNEADHNGLFPKDRLFPK